MELGTLEYPYRSFKSAASEFTNHYSHTDTGITIYIKDVYVEADTVYFLNMTSITLTSHPDYEIINRRALLKFSHQLQHGVTEKSRFHILKNTEIKDAEKISEGAFGEAELSELSKTNFGFKLSRTALSILNVNFYSTELENFILPIYLQDKILKLDNLDLNMIGRGIVTFDPMGIDFSNIHIEFSRMDRFLSSLEIL